MKIKYIVPALFAFVALVVAAFFYLVGAERAKLNQEREDFARAQQEIMQEELSKMAQDYEEQYQKVNTAGGDGLRFSIATDSLVSQLEQARTRVQSLQQELQSTKATSTARIAELQREVGTLRTILKSYVAQIDSLHTANQQLRAENQEVRQSYERVSDQARQLTSEKEALTERVNQAAKLDATAISATPIDKKGRVTKKLSKMENIRIAFTVVKNITASVGNKQFYIRIMRPDQELMTKPGSGTFAFEGREIPFSIRRELEYGGEELSVVMYWAIEETLLPGTYRVQIFADGNMIGHTSFTI